MGSRNGRREFESIIKSVQRDFEMKPRERIVANRTNEREIISLFVDAISLAECRKLLSPFHGWNWIESNHRALKYLKADFPFALFLSYYTFIVASRGQPTSSPRNKYPPGPTKASVCGKNIKNEHDVFSNRSNFLRSRKIANFCFRAFTLDGRSERSRTGQEHL